jgi:hypothetical protein
LKVEVLEMDIDLKRISLRRLSGGKAPDNTSPRPGGAARRPRVVDQGFKIGSYLEDVSLN